MTFFVTENDAVRISHIVTVDLNADPEHEQCCEVKLTDGSEWWLKRADGLRLLDLLRLL